MTKTRQFQKRDTVTFEERDGRSITGIAVRINPQTVTVVSV